MANIYGNNRDNLLNGTNLSDNIYGYGGNDTLYGYARDDVLDGGFGADKMYGGIGNDTYYVDNTGDRVIENPNEGIDKVRSTISYTLPNNVENLTLLGSKNIDGTGNRSDNILYGNNSNNHLVDDYGNNTLYGNGGNDSLFGGSGNDSMYGGTGNDNIFAGYGDNLIAGGTGNDNIISNNVNDIYIFNIGDGQDTITNYGAIGTIKFGAGITSSDIISTLNLPVTKTINNSVELDLNLNIKGTSDKISIPTYNWDTVNTVTGKLEFSDGNILNLADFIKPINGTSNADYLVGTVKTDLIYGFSGDDTLCGMRGNDYLNGGEGNDAYIFNKGDGQDKIDDDGGTIQFGQGITKSDLIIQEGYYEIESGSIGMTAFALGANIGIKNSSDYINLGTAAYNYTLKFADGSQGNIKSILPTDIYGTNYNDKLMGNSNNNLVKAFSGNDTITDLIGGNDTIYAGSGDDSINVSYGNYKIFGEDGNDNIHVAGSFYRGLGAGNGYVYGGNGNDHIFADDGSGLFTLSGGSGNDTITDYDGSPGSDLSFGYDIIYGDSGNDFITGGVWRDTIYGGSGNDYIKDSGNGIITGGTGNDTIIASVYNFDSNDDMYYFNKGDGRDWYQDQGGNDTIKFGNGITKSNLHFAHSGDNLLITFNNSPDSINIDNWFLGSQYYIENFDFADGTHLTAQQINAHF